MKFVVYEKNEKASPITFYNRYDFNQYLKKNTEKHLLVLTYYLDGTVCSSEY